MDAINKARPSGAKGEYIKRIAVNATMGPGIKIDPNLALSVRLSSNHWAVKQVGRNRVDPNHVFLYNRLGRVIILVPVRKPLRR